MFGPDVIIKPIVLETQTIQEVYLPDDEWVHLWTGKIYTGSQYVETYAPIGYPPVFYRNQSKFKKLFEEITAKYK